MKDGNSTASPQRAQHFLRKYVMDRARRACEGSPKYPNCRAKEGEEHPDTGKPNAVAMIRLEPGTTDPAQIRVMCTRCVLEFEFPRHKTQGWRDERASSGNLELFPLEPK